MSSTQDEFTPAQHDAFRRYDDMTKAEREAHQRLTLQRNPTPAQIQHWASIASTPQPLYSMCKICNGASIDTTIPVQGIDRFICPGHPEPASPHDGQLNEDDTHHVYYNGFGGMAISADGVSV